jgi:hypothetical protein
MGKNMHNLFQDNDNGGLEAKALQDRVVRIIKPLIPKDAEERVDRSYRQWNISVRDQIRNETALRLADGDVRSAISVKVVDGFPLPLADFIDRHGDPVLWRLIVGQPKLGGIIDGLNFFLPEWHEFEEWPKLPEVAREGREHLENTLEIALVLQQLAVLKEVQEKMKHINHDILGLYRFSSKFGSQVELYWMAIAMVAAMLDVRIEDLTVVVLAHELAHGYTHIGCDIDGFQWSDHAFAAADLDIVEGLAQFYTEAVVTRLAGRVSGPKASYERFLKMQSGSYLAHREWLIAHSSRRGEMVRQAMLTTRRNGIIKHEEWQSLLEAAMQSLGSRT